MGAGGSAGEEMPQSILLHSAAHPEVFSDRRSELLRAMRDHSGACLGLGQDSVNELGACKNF